MDDEEVREGMAPVDNSDREEYDERILEEKAARRAHFPNLNPAAPLRESDEYPTPLED